MLKGREGEGGKEFLTLCVGTVEINVQQIFPLALHCRSYMQ